MSEIVTDISEDELSGLSEFSLLAENAEQAGVTGPLPEAERVDLDIPGTPEGRISALRWGHTPRVVFLHGGGQNAHTWDTVIVGLGEPALAVDLPGHGHSGWREDGDYSPQNNAAALAPVLSDLAPEADLVVGMSLGGLTAIRLAAAAPALVDELVLVDVTPSALQRHAELTAEQQGTVALMHGEREFPSFQAMLDLTIAAAPHREVKALRRGVFHNSRRLDNGNWTWRYDAIRAVPDFGGLWDDVDADVLAAANGVSDVAVMRGVLRLQLHTDADGEIRAHERGHVTTVGSARVEHSAEQVDQRARLVALHRVARILDNVSFTEMLCAPG